MKPLPLVIITALAAFAVTGARAEHRRVNVDVGISIGTVRPAPVYVAPSPVYVAPVGHRDHPRRDGYWDNVTVKTWVPGRWGHTYDRWGHARRVFEKGHYVFRTERVWVETDHRGRRHGGDYKHAYNGGHRRWNR